MLNKQEKKKEWNEEKGDFVDRADDENEEIDSTSDINIDGASVYSQDEDHQEGDYTKFFE